MGKRKITVTVDADLVEAVQSYAAESLSHVVNVALAEEVERRSRTAALGRMLAEWDAAYGPVAEADAAAAKAAFDDVDATSVAAPRKSTPKRRGVA